MLQISIEINILIEFGINRLVKDYFDKSLHIARIVHYKYTFLTKVEK